MKKKLALILFSLGAASVALAQPVLRSVTPVLNSASYNGPELGNGGGIAQGSLFALFGSGMGDPNSYAQALTYPLQTNLGGVSIDVTVGGTVTHAIMLNVYYGQQINAVLPSATPVGTGTMTVTYAGVTSAPAPIVVVGNAFGIYSTNSQGTGQAAATDPSFNANSIIHTFHPGDPVILWGTGLGAVNWDETEPPPSTAYVNLPAPVTVYVGNTTATPAASDYHGRSQYAGLDQIVFTVPAGVEGCYVPVAVKAGAVISNFTTIAVSSSGDTCTDSPMGRGAIDRLAAGETVNFGWIRLEGGAYSGDYSSATFNEFTPATAKLASYGASSGYCMSVEGGSYNGPFLNDFTYPRLNAGTGYTVQGPTGTFAVGQSFLPGSYFQLLNPNGAARVLWAGLKFTVASSGGADVGSIRTSDTMPILGSQITNVPDFSSRPRNSDLNITWNPAQFPYPTGVATLGGASVVATPAGSLVAYSQFECTVPVAAGQFTVPAVVLSTLVASGMTANGHPTGYMWLGQYDIPQAFTATGLDIGLISSATFSLTQVGFQ